MHILMKGKDYEMEQDSLIKNKLNYSECFLIVKTLNRCGYGGRNLFPNSI